MNNTTVSICTPTYNRVNFINGLIVNIINQDYPKYLIEWVIVDDGEDKTEEIIEKSKNKLGEIKIVYVKLPKKVCLGKKRNIMHKYCTGNILVYMDDDDYYPPTRVSHAVEMLNKNPKLLCAGCSKIYVYFMDTKNIYHFGPYHSYHATANTFAFRRKLLEQTKYDDNDVLGEESKFLKNYQIPMIQLNTLKTILVISHQFNTFDKRQILKQGKKSKNAMKHFTSSGFSQQTYSNNIKI